MCKSTNCSTRAILIQEWDVSNQEIELENLAAELTSAVYPIALRHGMQGSWIEVELGLWRALAEALKRLEPGG